MVLFKTFLFWIFFLLIQLKFILTHTKLKVEFCSVLASTQRTHKWASLVAQWLGVCLLMRGTRVRALVWEDPTCRGATGPVSHNY